MKTIEIVISRQGETRIETKGFAGAKCRQASEFIESALGHRNGEQLTNEFYQPATEQQTLQEGT